MAACLSRSRLLALAAASSWPGGGGRPACAARRRRPARSARGAWRRGAPSPVSAPRARPRCAGRLRAGPEPAQAQAHGGRGSPAGGAWGWRGAGGESLGRRRFQRRVPAAVHHVGRQHAHAVAAGVLHQLGRRVEAHGLGIEQGGQEGLGLVALEPSWRRPAARSWRRGFRESRIRRSPRSGGTALRRSPACSRGPAGRRPA